MDRKSLKTAIIVLGLIIAVIHLVILNIMYFNQNGIPNVIFTLAGLAFLVMLGGVTMDIQFLAGKETQKWLHYVFIALALATVLGFFLMENEIGVAGLGYFSVLIEVGLMVALYMHMQQVLSAPEVVETEMAASEAEEDAPVQKAVEVEG
ncbi:MAG: hypothetical protein JXB38_06465 [Anaerolineales bacterium]|nr:hypothetical protein [Anaerolineales bacterium]